MSQRFIRCRHCGLPHSLSDEVCPVTGKPVRKRKAAPPLDRPTEPSSMASMDRHDEPIPLIQPRSKPSGARIAVHTSGVHPTHEHPLLGRVISEKYGVRAVIGEGGMGTVYEAEHLTIGRKVAIKVLNRAHLGRREAVARFHQEARAAGAIGHPNICEIYDVGNLDDGSPYLVMERLHGNTLADRINLEGALPFDEVIAALTQVLSALVAAHGKNIIHRDVKPENIFLSERVGCAPVVKILDFGISKFEGEDPELSLTRTGMVMGTPFYMAPEQARGEVIDHRVDIYACGVILYEALTGRRPFIANNYNALVVQILATQPKDPREVRPAIPTGFVPIIFKALSKKRQDRFRNAEEFLKELLVLQEELARGPTANELARMVEGANQSGPPSRSPSSSELSSDSIDIPVVFSETGTGSLPIVEMSTAELLAAQAAAEAEAEAEAEATMVDDSEELRAALDLHGRSSKGRPPSDPGNDDVNDTIVDPSGAMLREIWMQLPAGQNPQARFRAQHHEQAAAEATQQTGELGDAAAEDVLRRAEAGRSERPPAAGRYAMVSDPDEATFADEPATQRGAELERQAARHDAHREPARGPKGLAAYMALAEGEVRTSPVVPAPKPVVARPETGRAAHAPARPVAPRPEPAPRPSASAPIAKVTPVPRPKPGAPVQVRPATGQGTPVQRPGSDSGTDDDDAVTTFFQSADSESRNGAQANGTERSAGRPDSNPTLPKAPRPPGTRRL